MKTRDERITDLNDRITWISHEMQKAPVWKRYSVWWSDRQRELEALDRALERIKNCRE